MQAISSPPEQKLMQLATGLWASQVLSVSTRVGLFEALADGNPHDEQQLAAKLDLHPSSMVRLLRGCASLELIQEVTPSHFRVTELGQQLTSQHPQSMRDIVMMTTDTAHWNCWAHLEHVVRTGQPAYEKALGVDNIFEYFQQQPEEAQRFNRAMASLTGAFVGAVRHVYDFASYPVIADIGGGHGQLLGSLLQLAPQSRGILFDQEAVVAGAEAQLQSLGVESRVTRLAGNFFLEAPGGADLYLLKHILHDWTDEQCHQILIQLQQSMGKARLLIVEMLLPEPPETAPAALMDLNMMVMTGGRERTENQFKHLLSDAGLRWLRTIPTQGPYHLLEAEKA